MRDAGPDMSTTMNREEDITLEYRVLVVIFQLH
jgi:hypothetical protein